MAISKSHWIALPLTNSIGVEIFSNDKQFLIIVRSPRVNRNAVIGHTNYTPPTNQVSLSWILAFGMDVKLGSS